MGECPKGSAVNGWGHKVEVYSCEAHHVAISAKKDCGGSKSEMGESEGGTEEGGIETKEPAASYAVGSRVCSGFLDLTFK